MVSFISVRRELRALSTAISCCVRVIFKVLYTAGAKRGIVMEAAVLIVLSAPSEIPFFFDMVCLTAL